MPRKKQPVSKEPFPSDSVQRFESEVQTALDTLTMPEKIRFLKMCIINFEHDIKADVELILADIGDGYYKRCKRALTKYEQLAALEEEQSLPTTSRNPDFTTARQVLAVHFLLLAAGMRQDSIDKTVEARLIEFLTGKNYRNIYDFVRQPFKDSNKESGKDLKFIKPYFEKLGLTQVIALIEKELKFTATE